MPSAGYDDIPDILGTAIVDFWAIVRTAGDALIADGRQEVADQLHDGFCDGVQAIEEAIAMQDHQAAIIAAEALADRLVDYEFEGFDGVDQAAAVSLIDAATARARKVLVDVLPAPAMAAE